MKKFGFWLLVWLPVIITAVAFPFLPEKIPTHWNFAGEINGWGSPLSILGLSFLAPIFSLGMHFLPLIDPKKDNYKKFSKSYRAIQIGFGVFFSLIQSTMIYAAFFPTTKIISTVVVGAVGILLCVTGNFMPKFKHNYFCGIKTPWTFASEDIWLKTHRFAGVLWFWGGILIAVSAFFMPNAYKNLVFFIVLVSITLLPCGYSWWLWQKSQP